MARRLTFFIGVPLLALAVFAACTILVSLPRFPLGDSGLCLPTLTAEASAGDQAATLNTEQRAIASRIIQVGQQRGLPPRAWQITIQAGKTESNLTNVFHGDRDSLGVFQMRPSMGWGTAAQVTNVDYAINKFYDVLLTVPGWETMRPGEAAQRVERSAFPHRYHRWEALAASLLSGAGIGDPSGCVQLAANANTSGTADAVLRFAHEQLGDDYVWGANGPDVWDCSSLTRASWQAGSVALPRISRDQYHAGQHIPLAQAQPGDLVFWGYGRNPAVIYHVGLYLGENKVLHAPQPGEKVEIETLWDGGDLVPTVTRPA